MTRTLLWSLGLLILLTLLLWPAAFDRTLGHPALAALDRPAESVIDQALTRALTTFALARATNALISVVQGTEVQLAPAGLGVTLTPGEVLDPLNDLVEWFSYVMLASATALGLQKFLLTFGSWISLKLLLAPALAVLLLALWCPPLRQRGLVGFGGRLVLAALVLRLSLPAIALANHGAYLLFLDSDYRQATQALEEGRAVLEEEAAPPEIAAEPGMMDRLKAASKQLVGAADLQRRLEGLQQRAAALIEDVLQLILVFVLNTILLPLGFLWGLGRLLRLSLRLPWIPIRREA